MQRILIAILLFSWSLIALGCNYSIHPKRIKYLNGEDIKIPQDTIIKYKKLNLTGWQKKTMKDYFVLIPPGYSFDYKYADYESDTATGIIFNANLKIHIQKRIYTLDTNIYDSEKRVFINCKDVFIQESKLSRSNNKNIWLYIAWDTTSSTILRGNYWGIEMYVDNWNPEQNDTIMAIFQSVGKQY